MAWFVRVHPHDERPLHLQLVTTKGDLLEGAVLVESLYT